ncbi:MAG: valine--tRNA ligase, partial [Methylobacteriaceae bacterium]|nr:valine--tRNA ligase [Methylobacteriaceae bacterium]
VVERQLEAQGQTRQAMGREAFIARVWDWKRESGGTITRQLRRLGASPDWARERFTMDEGLSAAVRKVFVTLYKEGLIYKDKRLVNWDPKLLTAISDLEVEQVEIKGHLWYFRYPIEGRADEYVVVATTRPETMLGDTAVAISPENERLKHLIGQRAILPLVGRRIPIVADAYADPEKGTGAVKITPAHDFNDFEVGRRHDLPLINVFDAEARLLLEGNEAFLVGLPQSADLAEVLALHGEDRFAARKKIAALLEARGLVEKIEPHVHAVPHGDRSAAVIEPWLTDQWYVDAKTLAAPALKAVREGRTTIVPKNWEKVYFDWLENIEPWCVSRQLWWGHQIPAWYGPDGEVFVEGSAEAAAAAAEKHYGKATELRRDDDVLDTWFSSALWPFSTLGWPDETPELQRYYPTSTLVTGFDILFFWVARMMMMGLHFMHEIPFKDVYIHALVTDERGAKMSKSKGNVIDPLLVIDEYGADALRFTLASRAAQGRNIRLSAQRVEGYRNFATKLWSAARFAAINECVRVEDFDPNAVEAALNKWILGEASKAEAEVTAAIESFRFNDAANACYRLVWNVFCDWYLELVKPALQGPDGAAKEETRETTAFVLDQILKLLHPFMPFLTEELWALGGERGPKRDTLLTLASWPQLAGLERPQAETEIGWVVDLVSEVRSVRSEMNVPAGTQIPLLLIGATADVRARAVQWGEVVRRVARLSEIGFADAAPRGAAQMIVRGTVAALPLAGIIDLDAERARLAKEIVREQAEARKVEAKLGNPDFIRRAPEEVVEENRERLAEATSRIEKLEAAMARLSS